MQYSSQVVGKYGLKVATKRLFRGETSPQPPCLFIKDGRPMPAELYPCDDSSAPESQFPSDNCEPTAIPPVYQTLLRLSQSDIARTCQAMLGLSQKYYAKREHNPPTHPSKKPLTRARILFSKLNGSSIDSLLEGAEI